MTRANVGAAAGAVALVLALSVDTPAARAARWQTLGRVAEAGAWHLWRVGILAHGRYADIMMDLAQKGPTSGTDAPA